MDFLPRSIDPLIYKVDSEKDWTNKVNPVNKKWMIMFWECLDDFENVAQYFGGWCLFPCTWNDGHENVAHTSVCASSEISFAITVYSKYR
jgi:hypothetical protein